MATMSQEEAIRKAVTRWEEQLKLIRDGVRDVQIKLDKLREEMNA